MKPTEVKKLHPDREAHAAPQDGLKELRKELAWLEASNKSGNLLLTNGAIRGAGIALYSRGALDDAASLPKNSEAINELRLKIAALGGS